MAMAIDGLSGVLDTSVESGHEEAMGRQSKLKSWLGQAEADPPPHIQYLSNPDPYNQPSVSHNLFYPMPNFTVAAPDAKFHLT
ncbi:uncharacterized protein PGTG_05742 [Puccinia graminis f. sp. tritici CRL 75-36-700-3]|uniref:Uncharacterized protein n=1 Tax=Puccinia graminis f. sp. tritici (strain CRL 75-36-700-3 / race SCCL) TaxID=418459 RepID=E3K4J4_PUCGT|nr:uncharacterized protein PGTG_05742 [Puccinia graminis f. sp. tritici CRL 75-36-700-3]EFP79421.2 hypothetical protein PGTG_05742 [Puccinia graminis f. sp. tritici CRL 75-36-700-3]